LVFLGLGRLLLGARIYCSEQSRCHRKCELQGVISRARGKQVRAVTANIVALLPSERVKSETLMCIIALGVLHHDQITRRVEKLDSRIERAIRRRWHHCHGKITSARKAGDTELKHVSI